MKGNNMHARKQLIVPVLFVLIALLGAVSIYISIKRTSIYSYEVAEDYKYSFHETGANTTDLNLENGKITLPEKQDSNQSTFLKVNIQTTFMGKYLLPSIQMTGGKSSFTQYFEHGAKGIRYLNVSSLMDKKETPLRLQGNHISIDDQTVELITFKNQDINKLKILVVAPHPDDAEIAAYGLYSSNKNSYILTITAGDAGKNKYDEVYKNKIKQYFKKGELRTWNSITVPMLGGISPEQTINLGFFDSTLKTMFRDKSKQVNGVYTNASDINTFRKQNISSLSRGLSGKSDWTSLVTNLEYLLKTIQPDIIVTPYPALDRNSDHKLSSVALFEAIKNSGIKNGYLYLYTNHFVLNKYYPYGEIFGAVSIPPNFGKEKYFDGIYSHNLTIDQQKDKIFALEAMNDLRLDTEWRSPRGAIKQARRSIRRDILGRNNSYYRRAVRGNELFFVINIDNIYNQDILNRIVGKL
jgi:LmbE family N-acetylglucosaminyl deacetylase